MDPLQQYDDIPWELIESALQERLSPDEDLQFREWLAVSADNQEMYTRLQELWSEGLTDYRAYREADEGKAWEAVKERISDKKVIRPEFGAGSPTVIRLAAAVVVLLAVGAVLWYRAGRNAAVSYETAQGEQRKIALPDGTTVEIDPQTRLTVGADYDKAGRTISLAVGRAHFEVSHRAQIPFQVDMDGVSVRDIGTAFTIERTKEQIQVIVSSGKVAFVQKSTGESRELSAGSGVIFYVPENRFGEVGAGDTLGGAGSSGRFVNSPLKEVIAALAKASGKRITLDAGVSGEKRLTVNIGGVSVEDALKIICASLDLEYLENNDGFIIKSKAAR